MHHTASTEKKTIVSDLLILTALWLLSLAVINPRGDFPINDDWAFGASVKALVEHGEFHQASWASMPLLTNVLWGALFCLPAGFSFTALRISTLVLAWLGILGTYWLAKEFRLPRWAAWFGALSLGFNPIYCASANSFMTDASFTAISVFAVIFLFRNLKTGSDRDFVIGLLITVAATLSRQLALAIPLGYGVALFLREGFSRRTVLRAVGPTLICASCLVVYQHWLAANGQLSSMYSFKTNQLLTILSHPSWLPRICELTLYTFLMYLGLFNFPVLMVIWSDLWSARRKQMNFAILFSLLIIVPLTIGCIRDNLDPIMPVAGNIIAPTGIGPQMLRDFAILHLNHLVALPKSFWLGVTIISVLGAMMMLAIVGMAAVDLAGRMRPGKSSAEDAGTVFLILGTIAYLLPLMAGGFFDRYLIAVIPWMAVALAGYAKPEFPLIKFKLAAAMSTGVIIITALFAVAGTRDFMTWNRLRWQALHDLMHNQHVKPDEIDGGFEFGGLYFYDLEYRSPEGKSYWWVHDDVYQIGFGPVPGTSVIKEYKYYNWLPPHPAHICVLKRNPQDSQPTAAAQIRTNETAGTPPATR
jgi:hypothetical protein